MQLTVGNSAGVMAAPWGKSVDGVETHFAVNHLGHFLLTNLLMPALRKGDEPRVVNLTSGAHALGSGGTSRCGAGVTVLTRGRLFGLQLREGGV